MTDKTNGTGDNGPFLAVSIKTTSQFTRNWFQVHEVAEASASAFTVSDIITVCYCSYTAHAYKHANSTQTDMIIIIQAIR